MERTNRQATWANIGKDVSSYNNDIDVILRESGLDYRVVSRPVNIGGIEGVNDRYHAIVRESDDHVYQIAKKSYTICQNRDAFQFVEGFGEDVNIVKAGETSSGMIYLIGELPETAIVGDKFKPYLIIENSHNSDFALKAAVVPLRIVCQNQFNIAFREAKSSYSVKHTTNIQSALGEASRMLETSYEYMKQFNNHAETLAAKKVNIEKVSEYLFPMPLELSERSAHKIEENKQTFLDAYNSPDNANFKGTAWGALNAATDYYTHKSTKRGTEEGRFVQTVVYPEFLRLAQYTVENI